MEGNAGKGNVEGGWERGGGLTESFLYEIGFSFHRTKSLECRSCELTFVCLSDLGGLLEPVCNMQWRVEPHYSDHPKGLPIIGLNNEMGS